jgi:hypothetical protein
MKKRRPVGRLVDLRIRNKISRSRDSDRFNPFGNRV